MMTPNCHPEKPYAGRGLCRVCYRKWRLENNPTVKAICHPDRVHLAKGLCSQCYNNQKHIRLMANESGRKWYEKQLKGTGSARVQEWRVKNYDRYLKIALKSKHKRRALQVSQADGSVTSEFLTELLKQTLCYYCREKVPVKKRTIEHLQPLSCGGEHSAHNIVMACHTCNVTKKEKTVAEFIAWRQRQCK